MFQNWYWNLIKWFVRFWKFMPTIQHIRKYRSISTSYKRISENLSIEDFLNSFRMKWKFHKKLILLGNSNLELYVLWVRWCYILKKVAGVNKIEERDEACYLRNLTRTYWGTMVDVVFIIVKTKEKQYFLALVTVYNNRVKAS